MEAKSRFRLTGETSKEWIPGETACLVFFIAPSSNHERHERHEIAKKDKPRFSVLFVPS
jgi:hypothetical protein